MIVQIISIYFSGINAGPDSGVSMLDVSQLIENYLPIKLEDLLFSQSLPSSVISMELNVIMSIKH